MTENETQEPTKRNTACEVRFFGENGRPTGSQKCDSQPQARAWIRENKIEARYEIVRVLEEGVAVLQSTCTLQPLPDEVAEEALDE